MIIKSMSRKHPSFAQLIDYIEGESKLKSRRFSIHHNTYSRHKEDLKREFEDNARHLRQRKNGVYLYHEVLSITRSHTLTDEEQKTILKQIVESYLAARGKRNLAYAVLHEDTDNLHFHIVMSANEVGAIERKRLSKVQFADIQTQLEAWVLREYPALEQKAVFHKNQTMAQRAEREAKRQHLSDKGEQMKRRGAKTDKRDQVQERLADIFSTATDPRHFAELMERAGFTLYTRGKTHGITDREGNKYRLARLGLTQEWERMDEKMKSYFHAEKAKQAENTSQEEKPEPKVAKKPPSTLEIVGYEFLTGKLHEAWHGNQSKQEKQGEERADSTATKTTTEQDPIQTEAEKRLAEMKAIRAKRAAKQQAQTKRQDRER
jgi:uncharacterized protein YeeX (DUF496 family)